MVALLRKGAGPGRESSRFRVGECPNRLFRPVGFRLPGHRPLAGWSPSGLENLPRVWGVKVFKNKADSALASSPSALGIQPHLGEQK